MRPADLGRVASLGIAELTVFRRLPVALFYTGDELRTLGQALEPGCVYDSNRYSLLGALQRPGTEVVDPRPGGRRSGGAASHAGTRAGPGRCGAHQRRRERGRHRPHTRGACPPGRGGVLEGGDAARTAVCFWPFEPLPTLAARCTTNKARWRRAISSMSGSSTGSPDSLRLPRCA